MTTHNWSPLQDKALKAVAAWLADQNGPQVFRLFGYAGTGKTTLAQHFAQDVGKVFFGAFTGKAAHVLKKKGCANATTIHSLIYTVKQKSAAHLKELEATLLSLLNDIEARAKTPGEAALMANDDVQVQLLRVQIKQEETQAGQPGFSLNNESEIRSADLVVIDEVSMVNKKMGEDLLSFGKKVLVLGDPAQLPPVYGSGYFTDCKPDIMLTEIHRQAEENPIIRMATMVREGKTLSAGAYGESRVYARGEVKDKETLARNTDQILVGRNLTRQRMNKWVRGLLGRESWAPDPTDRLVCLRNDHEAGLLNGAIWNVDKVHTADDEICRMDISSEDDDAVLEVNAHSHYFQCRDKELNWWDKKAAQEFDYGYGLTVHKSQGSQWDNVLLLDESAAFKDNQRRWLYTGLTRAAKRVEIVKM